MLGALTVLGVGYVLGAKAGRKRYEQIVGTARTISAHPATKSVLDAGRRKIAERVSPDADFMKVTEIDSQTTVIQPNPRS